MCVSLWGLWLTKLGIFDVQSDNSQWTRWTQWCKAEIRAYLDNCPNTEALSDSGKVVIPTETTCWASLIKWKKLERAVQSSVIKSKYARKKSGCIDWKECWKKILSVYLWIFTLWVLLTESVFIINNNHNHNNIFSYLIMSMSCLQFQPVWKYRIVLHLLISQMQYCITLASGGIVFFVFVFFIYTLKLFYWSPSVNIWL